MNQFYVSIVFLGMVLVVTALVWVAYDRKKSKDYAREMDEKKDELVNIIADAEQMVEELNKFSGYVVNQLETKKEELFESLDALEEKKEKEGMIAISEGKVQAVYGEKVVNGSVLDLRADENVIFINDHYSHGKEHQSLDNPYDALPKKFKVIEKTGQINITVKEKVIPISSKYINSKYREVLFLAEDGLAELEIARQLKLGKGEVELILCMNR